MARHLIRFAHGGDGDFVEQEPVEHVRTSPRDGQAKRVVLRFTHYGTEPATLGDRRPLHGHAAIVDGACANRVSEALRHLSKGVLKRVRLSTQHEARWRGHLVVSLLLGSRELDLQ